MRKLFISFIAMLVSANIFAGQINHADFTDRITDIVMNRLVTDNTWSDASQIELDQLRQEVSTRVSDYLATQDLDSLNLDAESTEYFLGAVGDLIGSVFGKIKDVASKAFKTLKGVGDKMFGAVKGGFKFVKNNLGTIAKSSVSFIANVANIEMVQNAAGWAAEILLKAAKLAAPLTAAIPGVGLPVAAALETALAFASTVVTKDNVAKAVSIIGGAAEGIDSFLSGKVAPGSDAFAMMHKKGEKTVKPPKGSVEATMTVCANFMKYAQKLKKLSNSEASAHKTCSRLANGVAENM
jgi:hypothetical protein